MNSKNTINRKTKPKCRSALLSIIFLLLMALCTFTPLVWNITGKRSEEYPELLFAIYGMPLGIAFVIVSFFHWFSRDKKNAISEVLNWNVTWFLISVCVATFLMILGLFFFNWRIGDELDEIFAAIYDLKHWILLFILELFVLVVAVWYRFNKTRIW